ncbi:MAG: transposase [Flavobacteriaceae bacterium]|nr:transposase [Flavobacteriaceae bacterium]
MRKNRRKFTSEYKSKVAIEALKERYSLSELAERFELHPNQINQWKQEFLEKSKDVFDKKSSKPKEDQVDLDKLYAKIGQLEVERDYLKTNLKKLDLLG